MKIIEQVLSRFKFFAMLTVTASMLTVGYSNCSPVAFQNQPASNNAANVQNFSGTLTVGAAKSNPPLDLFFVVDNSASMLGHQINLGAAFSNIFTANSSALSNFDTNVYLFSTASTVNPSSSFMGQVPSREPSSVTTLPPATASGSAVTDLANVPGSIFATWNTVSGQYGVAPFNVQIYPAPVLNMSGSALLSSLHLAKQGSQTSAQYQSNVAALTQQFQQKIAYLNPTNQLAYEPLTNVSSGLCSIARILRHPANFINAGDAAAFVIVSDDNDRLNDRSQNNLCLESELGANEVINGTCGHYQTNFSYDTTAAINYQTTTQFKYQSGTQVNYAYPASESCHISYNNGYNYTWKYTAVQTAVTYTVCNETGDGTCLSSTPNTTVNIAGNYVASGTTCSQDMSTLVPNPAPGTSYSCAGNNLLNQTGTGGVDANSNGSQCSTTLLAQLNADKTKVETSCTITTASTATKTVSGQALGSCASFCANNSPTYSGCVTTSAPTTTNATGSISFTEDGITCASQCPNSTQCGTGTISSYLTTQHAGATCTTTPLLATLTVNAGANSDGSALTCSNSLTGLTVVDSSNKTVCAGQSTVQSCVSSLQTGTATSPCTVSGGSTTNVTAGVDVTCTTSCADSLGFCASPYTTVASYLAQNKKGYCKTASKGGPATLALTFKATLAGNATCSTPCSSTVKGSCDGAGFGATDGSTVADYIKFLKGDVCTSNTVQVSDTATFAADNANTAAACTNAASPFFFASGSPYPASDVKNYVAGDGTSQAASVLQNYIVSQSQVVLGANNTPAVAVIGHMAKDDAVLYGTDQSTDYFNLAKAMSSNQVSSIEDNYSTALAQISNYIVQTTQNEYSLGIPSTNVVMSVSVMHQGTNTWIPVDDSLWTWSGSTLSVSPSAKLVVGDQLMYEYHN